MKNGRSPELPFHKPEGQVTRGKTAKNRLRRVDNFLSAYDPALLGRAEGAYRRAFFVDLGYGEEPLTTMESANRLRRVNPTLSVLGVEIDPERVASAQSYADERTFFRVGGFNLPLKAWPDGEDETVRLVRAFNVLRQYDEREVQGAYDLLFQHILPGGLLIEGTSDPFGSIWVANVVRKPVGVQRNWIKEAIVFSTNFRAGFDPGQFQPVLPKDSIHRVVRGEVIHEFLQAWKQTALETRAIEVWGLRQWFAASAQNLAQHGYRINLRRRWLRHGYLIWEQPGVF